jgi:hypothetical protein
MFGEVGRRSKRDQRSACSRRATSDSPDPDGDIDAGEEIGLLVGCPQFDLDIWIELQKLADDRNDMGRRKQHRCANFQ